MQCQVEAHSIESSNFSPHTTLPETLPEFPPGLKTCLICGVTLSSWKRRESHFRGSRHAEIVERRGMTWEQSWEVVMSAEVEVVDRVWEEMERNESSRET